MNLKEQHINNYFLQILFILVSTLNSFSQISPVNYEAVNNCEGQSLQSFTSNLKSTSGMLFGYRTINDTSFVYARHLFMDTLNKDSYLFISRSVKTSKTKFQLLKGIKIPSYPLILNYLLPSCACKSFQSDNDLPIINELDSTKTKAIVSGFFYFDLDNELIEFKPSNLECKIEYRGD